MAKTIDKIENTKKKENKQIEKAHLSAFGDGGFEPTLVGVATAQILTGDVFVARPRKTSKPTKHCDIDHVLLMFLCICSIFPRGYFFNGARATKNIHAVFRKRSFGFQILRIQTRKEAAGAKNFWGELRPQPELPKFSY